MANADPGTGLVEETTITVDLSVREKALQQRLRELAQIIQQLQAQLQTHQTEAIKIAGQLELLQELQRDGDQR